MPKAIKDSFKTAAITLSLAASLLFPSSLYAAEGDDSESAPKYEAVILECDPSIVDSTIESLEQEGVIVLRHRQGLMLCYVPTEARRRCVALKDIKGFDGRHMPRLRNVPTMREARKSFDAYKIAEGAGLPQAYDGTGVVVGLCDIGFDARHINFRTADGTASRIRRVTQYIEDEGVRLDMSDPRKIYDWHSDSRTDDHATHVAGILTGAYSMDGHQGMAPGAELVVSTSQLTDVGLLAGVEDIIEYAKEQKKPAVINLSVGSYTGPHDGSSLFCRYLDLCAEDAIICISAGNEGNNHNTAEFTFTEQNEKFPIQICSYIDANFTIRGITDLWMADDSPIYITPQIGNNSARAVCSLPEIDFSKTPTYSFDLSEPGSDPALAEMAKYFSGQCYLIGEVDPTNGRYHVEIQYDMSTDVKDGNNNWSKYMLRFEIRGAAGKHVNVYADGQYSLIAKLVRALAPATADNSISDLATGYNTISVGMTCNDETIRSFGGSTWVGSQDAVSAYSGYGTLIDGRVTPQTHAVGIPIVSSMNSAALEANPSTVAKTCMVTDGAYDQAEHTAPLTPENAPDHEYDPALYYYCANGGTSMSSPYTAGVIACWLQAAPQLTAEDVKNIIHATNYREGNAAYAHDKRNGDGWLRPYEGMQMVLQHFATGVGEIRDCDSLTATIRGSRILIANPDRESLEIEVFGTDGTLLLRRSADAAETSVDISGLTPGIKIMRVEGRKNGLSQSKIFKKFVCLANNP